jgi:hypothetical protein
MSLIRISGVIEDLETPNHKSQNPNKLQGAETKIPTLFGSLDIEDFDSIETGLSQ